MHLEMLPVIGEVICVLEIHYLHIMVLEMSEVESAPQRLKNTVATPNEFTNWEICVEIRNLRQNLISVLILRYLFKRNV